MSNTSTTPTKASGKTDEEYDFDLVFQKPHLTPDREEVKDNKKKISKARSKKFMPKKLPNIQSHEDFVAFLDKKGGKKSRKRKTKRKRGGKRRTKKKARKHRKKRKTLKRKH